MYARVLSLLYKNAARKPGKLTFLNDVNVQNEPYRLTGVFFANAYEIDVITFSIHNKIMLGVSSGLSSKDATLDPCSLPILFRRGQQSN